MLDPPLAPDVPADHRATATFPLRYEDVSQDGRLNLNAVPQGLGAVVWRKLIAPHPMTAKGRGSGVLPILAKLVTVGGDGPIGVDTPLDAHGSYQLGHTRGPSGEVDRIVLDMWVRLSGRRGRTHGPPPAGAGEVIDVGHVYARHVLSRLFAPPGERKVVRLDLGDGPTVPPAESKWEPLEAIASLPEGAEPLEDDASADPSPVVFGLGHTDSNQHVNSLVYPRLFEEAVLRRLAALGHGTKLLARRAEVGFRKPCFAGDRMRVVLRAFSLEGRLGAVGAFVPEATQADPPKPHAYARLVLEP